MVWENVVTVLEAAGMGVADIVRTGVYVTSVELLPVVNAARNRVLADATPATTVVVVAALANPKYLVEVDVVAAR
jgi:enamine deaminase RidA (YjgF/YER057c/UK114 family)